LFIYKSSITYVIKFSGDYSFNQELSLFFNQKRSFDTLTILKKISIKGQHYQNKTSNLMKKKTPKISKKLDQSLF